MKFLFFLLFCSLLFVQCKEENQIIGKWRVTKIEMKNGQHFTESNKDSIINGFISDGKNYAKAMNTEFTAEDSLKEIVDAKNIFKQIFETETEFTTDTIVKIKTFLEKINWRDTTILGSYKFNSKENKLSITANKKVNHFKVESKNNDLKLVAEDSTITYYTRVKE